MTPQPNSQSPQQRQQQQQPDPRRKTTGVRKRTPNACIRCRQQKIKCSGLLPCEQCTRRHLLCSFEDKSQKVTVTRGFLDDLERRAFSGNIRNDGPSTYSIEDSNVLYDLTQPEFANQNFPLSTNSSQHEPASYSSDNDSGRATPSIHMTNQLYNYAQRYVADSSGRQWYLGSSSNWAFSRRVLSMAYERVTGTPLSVDNRPVDGAKYDLSWCDLQSIPNSTDSVVPSSDYALYLINAVRFHCGQVFHLFDEESFPQHFAEFYENPPQDSQRRNLWYVNYLLILAFGKALVARRNDGRRPVGSELFTHAMKLLPDIIVLCQNPVEMIEILCCKALYLHSLNFRIAAYNVIGQALRAALVEGMHTDMQDPSLSTHHIERCRKIWWTVYILDRQMSALVGVPVAIRDEEIDAALPTFSGSIQKNLALELNVKLSKVMSQILSTVYGENGRLHRNFVNTTKTSLKAIASIAEPLAQSFPLPPGHSMAGLSRLSAYLHLLYHQCIVLTTRPLLFSFLKVRLERSNDVSPLFPVQGSARALLQTCIEASQHILSLLDSLNAQDLLESFLVHDLEAAYAASMVLLIAPVVDTTLLDDVTIWLDFTFKVLDEMIYRGNQQAATRKSELQELQQVLNDVVASREVVVATPLDTQRTRQTSNLQSLDEPGIPADSAWQNVFSADQLMLVAETLDLEGMDWMTVGSSNFTE